MTLELLAQAAVDPGLPGSGVPGGAEAVAFWILGPLALAGALGMVFARNAVHSALCLAGTMLLLGFLYMAQGALFLGFVQIIVYTGAIMMLFLFVLMLVGRDSSDSVVEVLRGRGETPRQEDRRVGRQGHPRRRAGRARHRSTSAIAPPRPPSTAPR